MTVHFKNCSHSYEEILEALKESLPDAYLLDVTEREECLSALVRVERVLARLNRPAAEHGAANCFTDLPLQ